MWTQVNANDVAGLDRHVAIMQQMDPHFLELRAIDVANSIRYQQGEAWHYQGTGFEIAMMFCVTPIHNQWNVPHVGFVGNVQPAEVLDLTVSLWHEFLQAHGVTSVFVVHPKTIDCQPLRQYHNLVPAHPRVKITLVKETDAKSLWQAEYVSPA